MPRVYVWAPAGAPPLLAARTLRCVAKWGVTGTVVGPPDADSWQKCASANPVVLLQAGVWFSESPPPWPQPSASGLGLCAIATPHARRATEGERRWAEVLAASGGSVAANTAELAALTPPPAVFLDRLACETLLVENNPAEALLPALLRSAARLRIVAWPGADVVSDDRMRVLQIVTSLQRGGAERIALTLAELGSSPGVHTRLAAPFQPTRAAFALPAAWLDLARLCRRGETPLDALLRAAVSFDVLHLHLFKSAELHRFCATSVPTMVTVHNARAGWPPGLAEMRGAGLTLAAACSLDVAAELRTANFSVPVRTVWNGIDFDAFQPAAPHTATRARLRAAWGFTDSDLVLLAIANPRPQKRLHLLPAILAAVQSDLAQVGSPRVARLVLAGQPSETLPDAQASDALVRAEVARLGLATHVRWTGAVEDIPSLLAAGDVLVSASTHEGHSLVHLEALALAVPVVCTATAGTRETAHRNPAMRVLPLDAPPAAFAAAILAPLTVSSEITRTTARRHFDRRRMAQRYLWCHRRCIVKSTTPARGLWIVTNNFSMGGAQTSARRLLGALAERGIRVRATTVQESPDHPTPGRLALQEVGIPVSAFGPHGRVAPETLAAQVLEAMDNDPPEAVLFWNLIPVYKLLLADGLWHARVFDVSPGEMFFDSLGRYFENPDAGLPYLDLTDYGNLLSGVIVKYHAEAPTAAALGVPVHVVPNGVPLSPLARHPAPSSGQAPLVFGTATRVHPHKRLEDVIAALQRARPHLPPFEFTVAGRIEPGCEKYHAELVRLAEGLPIRWFGELPDTVEFLGGLDVFLMSSEPAGCPNALLEALAAGLPTVATDVGGAREQVIDGVTGRLVPARDVAALAEAIVALAMDQELRRRLGRQARAHILENFSLERMAGRYLEICLHPS